MSIVIEAQASEQRLTELGVLAWPQWKDPVGSYSQNYEAEEKSYFLEGEAWLSMADEEPQHVSKGDLITIPCGVCHWRVLSRVRRHYRSEALSPACCIV